MNRRAFDERMQQIADDFRRDSALIDQMQFPANITEQQRFARLAELRGAAEQKYVDASIALQRELGVLAPVVWGRAE